jgi:hypothetical protein
MRHLFSWSAVLCVPVLLSIAPLAEAQRKVADKDLEKNSEKMIKAGQLVAKVAAVYESKKSLRLTVAYSVPKLNQGAVTGLAQAQQQYTQALSRRPPDYNAARQAQLQMLRHQANLYTYEQKSKDVEVETIDDLIVRNMKRPEKFDDKGKVVKKFTKEELKELKGDPKLPGWKAEFSDIQTQQLVRVHLVKKKGARPPPRKKDKEDPDLLADHQPKASMIVILRDPPPAKN